MSVPRREGALRAILLYALADDTPSDYSYLFLLGAGARNRRIITLASCVHLFQTSTFVLDDVIDDSSLRAHRASLMTRFGVGKAIVGGQLLQAIALRRFCEELDASRARDRMALAAFASLYSSVYVGQFRDIHSIGRTGVSLAEYRKTVSLTTGEFLGAVARVGGLLGTRRQSQIRAMERYAYSFGMALQVSDDILDLTDRRQEGGKPFGVDLRTRRLRMPEIVALGICQPAQRKELRMYLCDSAPSARGFSKACRVVGRGDVMRQCARSAVAYLQSARRAAMGVREVTIRLRLLWLADQLDEAQGLSALAE